MSDESSKFEFKVGNIGFIKGEPWELENGSLYDPPGVEVKIVSVGPKFIGIENITYGDKSKVSRADMMSKSQYLGRGRLYPSKEAWEATLDTEEPGPSPT